jgi:hypothetical protein
MGGRYADKQQPLNADDRHGDHPLLQIAKQKR